MSPCLRLLLALSAFIVGACDPTVSAAPDRWFDESAEESGLPTASGEWAPDEWPPGTYFLPEIMQGGVGLFDQDGDGDLDLAHVRVPAPDSVERTISNRFYRQERGTFADATDSAGLDEPGFGQGLAVGDVDNDGDLDLLITNYGPNAFYRNEGDGSFANRSDESGLRGEGWSTSAAFADYDADGYLDLYVARYLRFDAGKRCTDPSDRPDYCGPRSFNGMPDRLYRNAGDGTFVDVTQAAGIVLPQQGARATGLGVVFTDLTSDGRPDAFVANDAQANQLWVNRGDGTFADEAILRGVAFDTNGGTEANMGIGVGDVNGDGALDLFTTHMWEESHRLYLGTSGPCFRDFTVQAGLARFRQRTGFGCGFFDFDHDGDLDLAVANGAVRRRPPLPGAPAGMWADYAEPNQLFENDGRAVFTEVNDLAGPFASDVEVSRGLAFGDVDEDGDVDLVLSNVDNSLRFYRNRAPKEGRHWLLVRCLVGKRDALGAQLWLRTGGRELRGLVLAGSSYCSSNDPRAHFGLGPATSVEDLEVAWPDGKREHFHVEGVDRVVTVRQGEGRVP